MKHQRQLFRARSPVGGSDRGSAKDVEATIYLASRFAA